MKNNHHGNTPQDQLNPQEQPQKPEIYRLAVTYDYRSSAINIEAPQNRVIFAGLIKILNDFYDTQIPKSVSPPPGQIVVPGVKIPPRIN